MHINTYTYKYRLKCLNVFKYLSIIVEFPKVRVFENRVLRRIFGPKRDEVMGGWRKLHYEELHNLYSYDQVKEDEMDRACSTNGGEEEFM
jgi:hypothetical protein